MQASLADPISQAFFVFRREFRGEKDLAQDIRDHKKGGSRALDLAAGQEESGTFHFNDVSPQLFEQRHVAFFLVQGSEADAAAHGDLELHGLDEAGVGLDRLRVFDVAGNDVAETFKGVDRAGGQKRPDIKVVFGGMDQATGAKEKYLLTGCVFKPQDAVTHETRAHAGDDEGKPLALAGSENPSFGYILNAKLFSGFGNVKGHDDAGLLDRSRFNAKECLKGVIHIIPLVLY